MRTVDDVKHRLEKAQDAYQREAAACDRELQAIVRIDPVHLKAAKAVQHEMAVSPELLELKANEQPEVEAPAKKGKK